MIKGSIDAVSKGNLVGWLTTNDGEAVPQIDCLVDGEFASSAEAFFRQDLKDVGAGDGSGGVRARVPSSYFDGRVHRVTLVGCSDGAILGEVSKELEFPRLLPLNPNPFLLVKHDKLEGWTPTLSPAEGLGFMRLMGQGMPHRYARYTRVSWRAVREDMAPAGLVQQLDLPARSESRRVLVILGKTPTLTPLVVEARDGGELVTVERVTLGPTWTTYHVPLGKSDDVSELRLLLEPQGGVALVDLAVVGVTEWDGKASALPPPPEGLDDKLYEAARQVMSIHDYRGTTVFDGPSRGSELADDWWFDCTPEQEGSFTARVVTSGTDLGSGTKITNALALHHAPLQGSSQVSTRVERGAFLSLPSAKISVAISYSSSGELVPPRTNVVLLGRSENTRTLLWSAAVDSPLPGRRASLTAHLSADDMAELRQRAAAYAGLEIGVEFRAQYAVTLHHIRIEPKWTRPVEEGRQSTFEDPGVELQAAQLARPVERAANPTATELLLDVVVPVFNATEFVLANLQSLVRANDGSYRVVVVDDASGMRTRRMLKEFADRGDITLLHHKTNQGYTRSVNAGVREGSAPFIVTLNSDTVVPKDWHRRLLAPFNRFERVGIVGPLSSAASWQSVPFRFAQGGGWLANSLPLGYDVDGVQEWLKATWKPKYPEIRLLNGFCMCSRRAVFEQIGVFDETAFPVGYGEENDLCLRASAAGWELRLVDDLYVFHAKSKSFGKNRSQLSKAGTARLQEKHPDVDWSEVDSALRHHERLRALRAHFSVFTGVVE